MENTENTQKFSSILPVFTPSGIIIPDFIDKKVSGKPYIMYGDNNKLPLYIWDNYLKCSELQSIVNTIVDYTFGDGIVVNDYSYLSSDGLTLAETIQKVLVDYVLFGGFTIECIRNYTGDIIRVNWQNIMNVRINEDLTKAYISNEWGRWTAKDIKEIPLYDGTNTQDHFIMYYRGNITRGWYPVPMYIAALKSIAVLNNIRNYNLHNIENNFSSNCIISINGSALSSKELQEIKDKLILGYTGSENAGRFILINNINNDSNIQVERLDSDKTVDLYNVTAQNAIDDVYAAFRINKMLIGRNVQTGFSKEEFIDAFNLYNKTVISPLQSNVEKCLNKLGISIKFKEFTISKEAETNE